MKSPDKHIFLPSGCIREEAMFEYLQGGFPEEIRKEIEAHTAACPLCREAMEGIGSTGKPEQHRQHLRLLRNRMQGSVRMRYDMQKQSVRKLYPVMAAAASVMILVGIFSVITLYRNRPVQGLAEKEMIIRDSVSKVPEAVQNDVSEVSVPETKKTTIPTSERKMKRVQENVEPPKPVQSEKISPPAEEPVPEMEMSDLETSPVEVPQTLTARPEEKGEMTLSGAPSAGETLSYHVAGVEKQESFTTKSAAKRMVAGETQNVQTVPARFVSDIYTDFSDYIRKNLVVPDTILHGNKIYDVTLVFIVDTAGVLTGIEVTESADTSLNREAVRVVRQSPRWSPAMVAGRLVPEKHSITVYFKPAGKLRLPD